MDSYYWVLASGGALLTVLLASACMVYRQRRRSLSYISALEKAADVIGNGFVFFDQNDRFVSANMQAHDFLSELLGEDEKVLQKKTLKLQDCLNYFYDTAVDCDQSLLNTLDRSAEKNGDVGFREVIMAPGNRLCLVEVQKIHNVGTNLILIDVGDTKNQEEYLLTLNQYNHELNQAIQAATSGIVVTKPCVERHAHCAVFVNKAFCDISQVSREDVVGKDIADIFMRINDETALEEIQRIGKATETGYAEVRIEGVEGDCWYDLKRTPVIDRAGNVELAIWIFSDMTALKLREAELSKTQKLEALGQLAAGVAHDFNNVLSIIDGYARITASNLDNHDQATDNLNRIRTASKRGANLIKKMLTFSRHEIVDDTVIDLGAVVREQELLLSPLLDASIKCSVLTDHQAMYIECPPENITQIVMNLVVNARDAMPQGGVLLLEMRVCPQDTLPEVLLQKNDDVAYASIMVSDTGMGMPKDVIDRMFDPFFTTKQQGKGTGLGLSMVYGLVKQIGGHIDVISTLKGGTTMTVYLPLTEKVPKQLLGEEDDISSIRFEGFTALVAEDEPDLLALVSGTLEDLGMHVLRARDGHEALAVQDGYEGTIDLLLSDVVMPELNGVDLADLLKELRPDVKIIFMSGYPAKGQMARVEIPEDAVFIAKPIQHDALIKIIYTKLGGEGAFANAVVTPRWASKGDSGEKKESSQ